MDAAERRDGKNPEEPRSEAERRADARLAKRAEALRANLKRRKSQLRARAEALHGGDAVLSADEEPGAR